MALVPDQKFSTFQNGGDLEVGDIIVGLRGGLNTRFTYTGTLPVGVVIPIINGGTGANNAADARTNLGLGTMATQDASAVAISGGVLAGVSISGSTITSSTAALTAGSVAAVPSSGTDIANKTYVDSMIGGTVASVSGTLNRITSTGGVNPVIDISASYVGQTSITTLGTVGTGTWQATLISPIYGGTGVNNGASTLTMAGSHVLSGAFASTFTFTGITGVTFPTSGILATTSQLPTGAALSKVDDTNVTLTLGGTPLTALLQATSLTLGWAGQLAVPRGGSGLASATAYAVLCGGTTSTSPFQSVASVGTSGQVLTSNGAGALPTFQSVAAGGTVSAGLINQLAWYAANGTTVSGLATAASGVLVTSAGSVPSISSTLPAGLTIPTPKINQINDSNGLAMLGFTTVASAVNNFQMQNNVTTGSPVLSAVGSDTNIGVQIDSKGTSGVFIKGQTTATLAPAGYRGEVLTAQVVAASALAMTNNTPRNITSVNVTSGTWLVLGVVSLSGSTANISQAISWCSTTSATLPDNSIRSGQSSAVTTQFNLPTAALIVTVSATTTVYVQGYAVFVTGTVGGSGQITAIRL